MAKQVKEIKELFLDLHLREKLANLIYSVHDWISTIYGTTEYLLWMP